MVYCSNVMLLWSFRVVAPSDGEMNNFQVMRSHLHPRATLVDERGGSFGFRSTHILLTEQELSIEICHIDRVLHSTTGVSLLHIHRKQTLVDT